MIHGTIDTLYGTQLFILETENGKAPLPDFTANHRLFTGGPQADHLYFFAPLIAPEPGRSLPDFPFAQHVCRYQAPLVNRIADALQPKSCWRQRMGRSRTVANRENGVIRRLQTGVNPDTVIAGQPTCGRKFIVSNTADPHQYQLSRKRSPISQPHAAYPTLLPGAEPGNLCRQVKAHAALLVILLEITRTFRR